MIRKGYTFDEVLIEPGYNDIASRQEVTTQTQFGDIILDVPIMSANMDTVTGHGMACTMHELGGLGFLHRFCSIEDNITEYRKISKPGTCRGNHEVVISLGVNEEFNRFDALYEVGARYFCVDVAHGHCRAVGRFVKRLKERREDIWIVAGNVATYAAADYLAGCGADAIKVGIGPGSACTTRLKAGVGVPQLTAIMEIARRVDRFIIADGGIKKPADFAKAIAAGADAIMVGGMLAGCDETPGRVIQDERIELAHEQIGKMFRIPVGNPYKIFRGMASKEAQEEYFGKQSDWKTSEGESYRVECKGPAKDVINDLMGGLRSAMTYVGARSIIDFQKKATFIEVSASGQVEGEAHGKGRL